MTNVQRCTRYCAEHERGSHSITEPHPLERILPNRFEKYTDMRGTHGINRIYTGYTVAYSVHLHVLHRLIPNTDRTVSEKKPAARTLTISSVSQHHPCFFSLGSTLCKHGHEHSAVVVEGLWPIVSVLLYAVINSDAFRGQ